jgi:hypothetical protein
MQLRRPWNRHNPRLLRQQPRRAQSVPPSPSSSVAIGPEQIHKRQIHLDRFSGVKSRQTVLRKSLLAKLRSSRQSFLSESPCPADYKQRSPMPELLEQWAPLPPPASSTTASTRFCSAVTGCTACARRIVLAPASDKPKVLHLSLLGSAPSPHRPPLRSARSGSTLMLIKQIDNSRS